jgi:peptidoglycan/LPS O-acetylase OafA/YrhL
MGSLRTLLAISVVFAHVYGSMFVGGRLAVQIFYVISGFLISFVITETKTYSSVKDFYENRLLRLFPIYWVVAIFTLIYIAIQYFLIGQSSPLVDVYSDIDWYGRIALTLSNIFLFGQDWIMFTGVHNGRYQFFSDFSQSDIMVWEGLIVPQAWTLGVELTFYLVAPFLLPNRKAIWIALAFSLIIRAFLLVQGIGLKDPWVYRFFPAELSLFLLGALSHQIWMPYLREKGFLKSWLATIATSLIILYISIFPIMPFRALNNLILIGSVIVLLPLLFEFQKINRWDRKIGDLSYSVYISHWFVKLIVLQLLLHFTNINKDSYIAALCVVFVTICFSYFLNNQIGNRIDDIRNKIKSRQVRSDTSSVLLPLPKATPATTAPSQATQYERKLAPD